LPVSVHHPLMANFLDGIFCHCGSTTVRPQPDRHLRFTCLTVLLTSKGKCHRLQAAFRLPNSGAFFLLSFLDPTSLSICARRH
jgi:hypothetical protein